jgi:hypothetical protein
MTVGRKPGGPKTGGRKKGTPNKITASVKAALEAAFEGIGGVEKLRAWAESEPTEFYKLWAKLLPTQVTAGGDPENPFRHKVEITFVRAAAKD